MARKYKKSVSSDSSIMLIDDNLEYLEATKTLIQREGHKVIAFPNAIKALEALKTQFFDVILVDYFMPEMTGEQFIVELRKTNTLVQVIMQTGYSSENPPREMLKRLDIQGYYDKSEGPDKLLLWLDIGIASAKTTQFLFKSRESLNYILNATPDLHKIQPLDDLLKGILIQVMGLLGVGSSFLAVLKEKNIPITTEEISDSEDNFIATLEAENDFVIQAATGRFKEKDSVSVSLKKKEFKILLDTLDNSTIITDSDKTYVPLKVADHVIGAIFLEREIESDQDKNLLNIFANQAAVAIHNSQLYRFATVDPLTTVYVRGYTMQRFNSELRNSFRNQTEHCLFLVDLDNLKALNDSYGHLVGDQALKLIGNCLKYSTRLTDIVGRYGGDEFIVLLPKSELSGAQIVLERIYNYLADNPIENGDEKIKISCSIGVVVVPSPEFNLKEVALPTPQQYFENSAEVFIELADKALYCAKADGKGKYCLSESKPEWPRSLPD